MKSTASLALVAIMTASAPTFAQDDATAAVVDGWYVRYLGRHGDPYGVTGFVTALRAGTMSPERVEVAILGSPEYFARRGSNEEGFIIGLYRDVLGRTPHHVLDQVHRLRFLGREAYVCEFLRVHRAPVVVTTPVVVETYRPAYSVVRPVVVVPSYRPYGVDVHVR
jgi:hypothetical protein